MGRILPRRMGRCRRLTIEKRSGGKCRPEERSARRRRVFGRVDPSSFILSPMPILAKETDIYPNDLLDIARADIAPADEDSERLWWAMYTRSRQEKQLMRKLLSMEVPFYSPTVGRRYRHPNGRVRTTYELLFTNYVFVYGSGEQRYAAQSTNCVSRWMEVKDGGRLVEDLTQIQRLIEIGRPLTRESRLITGVRVRVRTGAFAGFEGTVVRREGVTRLLVAVNFMEQGASVLLDDCQLDPLD